MRKELKIIEREHKDAKTGKKYYRYKTSEGWMSCFESEVNEQLGDRLGKYCEVEVAEREGGYKNITKVYIGGIDYEEELSIENKTSPEEKISEPVKEERVDKKDLFVLTSYAKDLMCAQTSLDTGKAVDIVWSLYSKFDGILKRK